MVEAKNFIEKELGKSFEEENNEQVPEIKTTTPIYTPPQPQIIERPIVQIVEKIVYKKQRIHGFFRTLTIIALLAIGFLMLGESTGILTLSVNSFKLHQIFPIIIILSSIIIRSYRGIFGKLFWLIIFMTIWWWMFTLNIYTSLNPSSKRQSGESIVYDFAQTTGKIHNFYIQTLISNSSIEGSETGTTLKWTWNSDRKLLISWGNNGNASYLKLNEDTNRNLLQKYLSTMDITIPDTTTFDLLYIKNFFWIHTIDLSTFQRKTCKFHAGIDDITIKVGNVLSGNKIEIQGAAANVNLDIPNDIGVIMYYKHLVGIFQASQFDTLSGHYFQSQNITNAKATLQIYINLWAGNTKINRVDAKK